MKKIIFLVLFFLVWNTLTLLASHIKGGEITWRCNGNGEFIFQVKEYRDCNGIPGNSNITLSTNAPGFGTGILCSKIAQNDISPVGPGCPTCPIPLGAINATEEFIYESAPIILNGIPPSTGWYFSLTDCCRNSAIINLSNPGGRGFTFRAIMYPFNGMNAFPCYDSSPQFAESPAMAISTGTPVNYSEAAFDTENDSLVYTWGVPLENGYPGNSITLANGYTLTNPLPGHAQNQLNTGVVLNRVTGGISFTSYTQGLFVTVLKVSAYRCNVLVSEIYRDIQFAILLNSYTANNALNTNPTVYMNGFLSDYLDTITAGDSISLVVLANDTDVLSAAAGGMAQTLILNAKSPEFGYQYQRTDSGCSTPPCAVLTNPTMPITSQTTAFNTMNWVSDCAHAGFNNGCLQHQRTYFFLFKVTDNMCPAQGITYRTAAITVTGPEIYSSGNNFAVNYPGVTVQWYLNGVLIPGATDTSFTPVQSGFYTLIATTVNGCSMISNSLYHGIVGIEAPVCNQLNIITSPNPIQHHQLNIMVGSPIESDAVIQLFDISGKEVYKNELKLQSGNQHYVFDIGELNSGIYQMSLVSGESKIDTKIIVQ